MVLVVERVVEAARTIFSLVFLLVCGGTLNRRLVDVAVGSELNLGASDANKSARQQGESWQNRLLLEARRVLVR